MSNTKLSIIAAMDQKRGIGKDNKIPWHIKEDLVHLKGLTAGKIVILGRKSYESMNWYYNKSGNPMPGKLYIVVSRDKDYKPTRENAQVSHSLEEAIKNANVILSEAKNLQTRSFAKNELAQDDIKKEVFIIGGGQIFEQALPLASKLYLTIVEARLDSPPESPARRGDFNCDTFFPDYSEFGKVVSQQEGQNEKYKFKFVNIER